jgi:O-antigen ligase
MNTSAAHLWWQRDRRWTSDGQSLEAVPAQASKLAFWALLAFTVVLILAPQDHFHALKTLHLPFVFAVIAAAAWLFGRFQNGSTHTGMRRELIFAALLLLWAIVTVPFSLWPGGSFHTIIDLFIKSLIVFWLLACVIDTPGRLKAVAWLLTLISIPLSLTAVHTFFSGGFQAEGSAANRIGGYVGALTGNPNDLALMLDLILPLTLGLVFCTRRLSLRIVLLALVVLDVAAIVATYSRAGFLFLATILLAYAISMWRRGAGLVVVILLAIGIAAVPMLHGGYINRLSTITSIQSDPTHSAQSRWQGMRDAAIYTLHHPIIGTGAGMSTLGLNRVRGESGRWHQVHDIYLQYSMDLGLPGLILFLLLLYGALKACRHACRVAATKAKERNLYFIAEAIGISLVGFIVGDAFYPNAYNFYFYYFAGLAVAAGIIASRITAHSSADAKSPPPRQRRRLNAS